jgi:hypothetical protein
MKRLPFVVRAKAGIGKAVIPAQAGIQGFRLPVTGEALDSRLRGNDGRGRPRGNDVS